MACMISYNLKGVMNNIYHALHLGVLNELSKEKIQLSKSGLQALSVI